MSKLKQEEMDMMFNKLPGMISETKMMFLLSISGGRILMQALKDTDPEKYYRIKHLTEDLVKSCKDSEKLVGGTEEVRANG